MDRQSIMDDHDDQTSESHVSSQNGGNPSQLGDTKGGKGDETNPGWKKPRRGKDIEEKRDHYCGCGKKYLSYPALYTHVKQKHNGEAPAGTSKQHSLSGKTGRGRPPKVRDENAGDKRNETQENPIHKFIYFLSELENRYKTDKNLESTAKALGKSLDIVIRIEEPREAYDALVEFPKAWFKKEDDYKKVYECLESLLRTTRDSQGGHSLMDQESNGNTEAAHGNNLAGANGAIGTLNANKIIALFLKEIKDYIKKDFFAELAFFLMMYRRALNEEGWKKIIELKGGKNVQDTKFEFCEANNGEYIPEICNEFILDAFQRYLEEYGAELPLVWLGLDDERMKNAVFFTHHFCNWLHGNKYTRARITLDLENEPATAQ